MYLHEIKEQINYEIRLHGGDVDMKPKKATVQDIKKLFGWINGGKAKRKK
jgi:hypothetical protein